MTESAQTPESESIVWRTARLSELGRIVTGRTPKAAADIYGDHVPFVTPTDMDGRRYLDRTDRWLSEGGFNEVRRASVPPNAVMVSCIGSDMGKVAVATQLCVTNQQINSLVVDTEDDSLFVYYNLSMRKQELQDIAGGSAQPILNKTDFGLLTLELPPPPIQRAIVRVLAVLDDKIEINRRMNRTLETLAQKLFKSWFVDFDPVVAKSEGRKPFGLSDELAALFPSEFEDTELGLVPLGWRPAPLGDAIQLVRDLVDPQAAGLEEFDHYSIPAFDSGQRPVREMGSAIKSGKYLVPDDAILLSKLNPETPRVWWPTPDAHRRAIASTEFLVCRARTGVSRTWLYWQLRDADFLDEFATRVTGTSNSHQRVRPDDLLRLVRLDPGQALRHRFAELVEASTKRMVVNLAQSQKLAALRDLLLPRLLSGELRVPVAESAMTAAL